MQLKKILSNFNVNDFINIKSTKKQKYTINKIKNYVLKHEIKTP